MWRPGLTWAKPWLGPVVAALPSVMLHLHPSKTPFRETFCVWKCFSFSALQPSGWLRLWDLVLRCAWTRQGPTWWGGCMEGGVWAALSGAGEPSCAGFKSVFKPALNCFRYLDFSDFSSSVWKPLKKTPLFFFSLEGFGTGKCLEVCSLSTECRHSVTPHGRRVAAPCPPSALCLAPFVQTAVKFKWCSCWGTDSLPSCPQCCTVSECIDEWIWLLIPLYLP